MTMQATKIKAGSPKLMEDTAAAVPMIESIRLCSASSLAAFPAPLLIQNVIKHEDVFIR
jgi:hypothetical protein